MVWMRDDSETISVVGGVGVGVGLWVVKLEVFDQGGEEDEERVPGQALPHAHTSTKPKGHKLVSLDETPGARVCLLKEPLRPGTRKEVCYF